MTNGNHHPDSSGTTTKPRPAVKNQAKPETMSKSGQTQGKKKTTASSK